MPAPSSGLSDLLKEWHAWTISETAALRAQDWEQVKSCQERKARLQAAMAALQLSPFEKELARAEVSELMNLEQANAQWLTTLQTETSNRRVELDLSARNLGKLRQSYSSQGQSRWESYS